MWHLLKIHDLITINCYFPYEMWTVPTTCKENA